MQYIWIERSSSPDGVLTMERRIRRYQIDHCHFSKEWLELYTCSMISLALHQSFQRFNSKRELLFTNPEAIYSISNTYDVAIYRFTILKITTTHIHKIRQLAVPDQQ